MKRKRLGNLFLGIASIFLITGCGILEKNMTGNMDGQIEEEISEQDGLEGPVSLTLWGAEEDGQLLARMVEDFKKEYAGQAELDITVEYVGESQCKDKLLEDIEGGADVFTFADDQLRVLVAAGALAEVEDAEGIRERNIEGASEAASVNGKLYAWPMTADNGYFLYYNKEYFSEEDVKSLDAILQRAQEAGKLVTMEWTSGWYLYSFFGCTDMELGMNEDGVSNYCNWNAVDTAIKGTDVAQAMLDISSSPAFWNTPDGEFVKGVENGSVIAGVSGVWNANAVEAAWGNNYGAVRLPTYTCAGKQVQMASFAGYKMLGVNAYSENREWAGRLAEWITNESNQTLRFVERGQGPSNVKAADSPEVADSPAIQAILMQSEFASLQYIGGNYWEPVQIFGQTMADGNPQGENLQELLDTMVEGITLSYHS